MRNSQSFSCLIFLFCHLFSWLSIPFANAQQQERRDSVRVRVDAYHAHSWIETLPRPGLAEYHLLHGPARALQALRAMGWECEPQLGPWNAETLKSTDLVFINLVSADRPPFLVSEVQALVDYVKGGGGVLLITDHTNCYFHNHVLGPLFHELGLELTNHAACENPPHTIGDGNGWIHIESFADHPMVKGIDHVAFQVGGSVDRNAAVAWTSPISWADEGRTPAYGEGSPLGFFGDYQYQPNEARGPIGVLAAKTIGTGRVAIIADQNAVGGLFLNYADNRRLWLQAACWTAFGNPEKGNSASIQFAKIESLGLAPEPERSLVWCLEPLSEHAYWWGDGGSDGLYHVYALLNKNADARATDRALSEAEWLFVPSDKLFERDRWRELLQSFLAQANRKAVVLCEEENIPSVDQWMDQWFENVAATRSAAAHAEWESLVQLPSGSILFIIRNRARWSNAEIPAPEQIRSDLEQLWDDRRLEWLWAQGIRRVISQADDVLWPAD